MEARRLKVKTLIAYGVSASLIVISLNSVAQQKCESLFADSSVKVLQELAQLKVEAETAPSMSKAKLIQKLYKTKYELARKANLDLSQLPELVLEARGGQQEAKIEKEKKRQSAVEAEKVFDSRWARKEVSVGISAEYFKFSPDGKKFLVSNDTEVAIYDAQTEALIQRMVTPNKKLFIEPIFSPDGEKIISSFWDEKETGVLFWDIKTRNNERAIITGNASSQQNAVKIMLSANGKRMMTFSGETNEVRIWDLDVEPLEMEKTPTFKGYGAQLSSDGKNLAMISETRLRLWTEGPSGVWVEKELNSININVKKLNFSPDGSKLIFVTRKRNGNNTISVLDVARGEHLFDLKDGMRKYFGWFADMSADGSKILTYGRFEHESESRQYNAVWDAHTGHLISILKSSKLHGEHYANNFARFNPDGNLVASYPDPGEMALWHSWGGLIDVISTVYSKKALIASPLETKFFTPPEERFRGTQWNVWTVETP
jgi:WD40 repeat protein